MGLKLFSSIFLFKALNSLVLSVINQDPRTMKNLYILLISTLFLSSCATFFSGTQQSIKILSEPSGADVTINGIKSYQQTPCRVEVKRRQKKTEHNSRNQLVIELEKDGYETAKTHNKAHFNGVTLLNVFVWPGVFLDLATGAHLKYDRKHELVLQPISPVGIPYRPEEQIISRVAYTPAAVVIPEKKISIIDTNIPKTKIHYPYRFALIIGNEDYSSYQTGLDAEVNVKYARRDAESFKKYAENTLGVPKENIVFLTDATLIKMQRALSKVGLLAKATNGKAEIIFYYAGHGLPHEQTKEPYLLPVDVSGNDIEFAIKLSEAYDRLTEWPSKRVTCFFDCCFSGGARNQGLVAARGVKIVPNATPLDKNLVVFSASSGDQSAMGYDKEEHGLFTFYLLKKLKETQGTADYSELADYVRENVAIKSLMENSKEQDPQVNTSADINQEWRTWSFE